jgi:hypothetical protein
MKKTVAIVIIILIVLAGAILFYSVYRKTHQVNQKSSNKENVAKPIDVKKGNQENVPSQNQGEKAVGKEIELQGKVMGIGESNIYVEKEGSDPETLNIDSKTPVFGKDDSNSGLWAITPGKAVKVKYDESTKNVISLTVLE